MTQNPPKKDKDLSGWQAPAVFKTGNFFSSTVQETEKQSTESTEDGTQESTEQSTVTSADNQTDSSSQTTKR